MNEAWWKQAIRIAIYIAILGAIIAVWAFIDLESLKSGIVTVTVVYVLFSVWENYQSRQSQQLQKLHDRLDRIEQAISQLSGRLGRD